MAKYCGKCGAEVKLNFCSKCGNKININDKKEIKENKALKIFKIIDAIICILIAGYSIFESIYYYDMSHSFFTDILIIIASICVLKNVKNNKIIFLKISGSILILCSLIKVWEIGYIDIPVITLLLLGIINSIISK